MISLLTRSFQAGRFVVVLQILLLFITTQAYIAKAQPISLTEILLAVTINQQDVQETVTFLQTPAGELLVSQGDIQHWDFVLPTTQPIIYQGQSYYFLSAIPGLHYEINYRELTICITVPAAVFNRNVLDGIATEFVIPTRSSPGAFLNYDVYSQSAFNNSVGKPGISGYFSAGVFNSLGTGSSGFLAQRLNNHASFTRLNTFWEKDFPEKMRTLIIGDSFSVPGMWGRSLDFGGIQLGTNFATQPAFITFPLPKIAGEAVVPTVADLYVNDALVQRQKVPPGPFTINSIPVITGEGTVNIVTTDILGRQQVSSFCYYSSNTLLKPGLRNYSYGAGFLRKDYGIRSNKYGQFLVVGTDRVGITDHFTAEWHAELLQKQQVAGLGGSYLVGHFGVVNLAAAASHTRHNGGGMLLAGFQHQARCGLNYGFNTELRSNRFSQVGVWGTRSAKISEQAFLGSNLWEGASLGVNYIHQSHFQPYINLYYDEPQTINLYEDDINYRKVNLFSISFNQSLMKCWFLNVTGQLDPHRNGRGAAHRYNNAGVFVTLTKPIGDRTTLNLGTNVNQDNTQGTVQLQRNLPVGPGWGYNLQANPGRCGNYQATVSMQNDIGTYSVGGAQYNNSRALQLQASGSAVLLGGHPYLARQLYSAFGVAHVADYSNVRVYNQNQEVGRTNHYGNVFIPNLLPYQHNPIRIETNDLPLDAELATDQIDVIPYYRSGLVVNFPIKHAANATATLVQTSGAPVPAGAVVTILGQNTEFPVADEGAVYLTGLNIGENHLQITWDEHVYYAVIYYVKTCEPIAELGTIICGARQ